LSDETFAIHGFGKSLREGRITCEEMTEACLERIREADAEVQAWAFLDPGHALEQARAADAAREEGLPLGPLHGIPFGVKDIFDTADMPTEDGTPLHAGRRPDRDATAVSLLRQAGAVILGKTVTTELALFSPGKTRNPHDPTRTPGGSSSGSAAAVAAGMVPVALGTQTNGSVIRPAAYCGVVGFKPTHGRISRTGVLHLSSALDQVGVFAASVEDAAAAAEALMAYDPEDADTRPTARPELVRTALEEPPLPPRLAFVKSPAWEEAEPETQGAFTELAEALGDYAAEVPLPPPFEHAVEQHRTIMEADVAVSLAPEYERGKKKLSQELRAMIGRGRKALAGDYIRAKARIPLLNRAVADVYDTFDAILTPATTGEAPADLGTTGSPVFCTIWTLLGAPAITLPLLQGGNALPLGVQLVGSRGDDARLLRTARWLTAQIKALSED
jgi:Asp-tRNA(Asn)/Glu-tRNA(Gln) amidotransferase A subunit family amidase